MPLARRLSRPENGRASRRSGVLRTPEEADALEIERAPPRIDRRGEHGPFDIVGDLHGCFDELAALMARLGYSLDPFEVDGEAAIVARHPAGRTALFVGDLCDRGPRNADVLRLVMGMAEAGAALCVIGNHDFKLLRRLNGRDVKSGHGFDLTMAELQARSPDFRERVRALLDSLPSHLWLDGGRLVVAHAGLKAEMHGRDSEAVRAFALFGETNGEVDEFGLPVRLEWARDYRGKAAVIFGHTPVFEAEWLNETLCVDTGCVFGNRLTALRWPEREIVSAPAARQYSAPARPLAVAGLPA